MQIKRNKLENQYCSNLDYRWWWPGQAYDDWGWILIYFKEKKNKSSCCFMRHKEQLRLALEFQSEQLEE